MLPGEPNNNLLSIWTVEVSQPYLTGKSPIPFAMLRAVEFELRSDIIGASKALAISKGENDTDRPIRQ
jgi:hypothetical protein